LKVKSEELWMGGATRPSEAVLLLFSIHFPDFLYPKNGSILAKIHLPLGRFILGRSPRFWGI
ncbi:MAG: hypothetical protein IK037_03905, partial [Clostridia bacterium]|nr:hypothetical protein [Clostridia bacterium]